MNPYPGKNSVIILDNVKIHHYNELVEIIRGLGCRIEFLPAYSPDFNPIETAFSTIKSWIRRNRDFMSLCNDPIHAIMIACSQITAKMAEGFFKGSIYM